MPNSRPSTVLAAICFLAVFLGHGLLSLARAAEPPPKTASRTETRPAEALPEQNKFYDTTNPDYARLQKANEALAGLPLDKRGLVDWMKALSSGAITPRAELRGEKKMEILNLDVVMKHTKEMPYVTFPHAAHTQWLSCANCHDKIFIPKAGANTMDMTTIFRGQDCGVCHDRVAFETFFSCERCHNVPHGDIKAWW